MFQDINPHGFDNMFSPREPRATDYFISYDEGKILLREQDDDLVLPTYAEMQALRPELVHEVQYLFSVDNDGFFLAPGKAEFEGYGYYGGHDLVHMEPSWIAFATATALHLADWYHNHQFCGRCAAPTRHSESERALICLNCGQIEYPKIAPVVIVGITNGEELLLTRYASTFYRRYALVAGFVEIGETLEDAARREVMEEVGLLIKNLRYYESQPWALSGSLLMGMFADVDGDTTVRLDDDELSEALWYTREEIPIEDTNLSLTWDMILAFKDGLV